jgi:hypothetical protein
LSKYLAKHAPFVFLALKKAFTAGNAGTINIVMAGPDPAIHVSTQENYFK